MNLLFFLTPKANCAYLYDDYSLRQAIERMENSGYAALPILSKSGQYRGTLNEGDLLWALKNMCYMDIRQAEAHRIMEISRRKDNIPVRVTTSMHDLVERASTQNFVPVVDDKDATLAEQAVMDTVSACTDALGDSGRVLLRKSGTEPVLRVMAEAGSREECEKNVDAIIESMQKSGHLIEVKK